MIAGAILGGAQAVIGGIQAISAARKAKRAQKNMQSMIDSYKPNESIMDYYSKALSRYNSNPYQSTTYQTQMQNAGRTTATGLSALGDRRSAVGGVSRLAAIQNDASLKAGMAAESQQGQQLGQLGQATGMKAQEDKYKFEAKYNLESQKAGAANQGVNAGIGNIFGGAGTIADFAMVDKMYGDGVSGSVNSGRRKSSSIGNGSLGVRGYVPTRGNISY